MGDHFWDTLTTVFGFVAVVALTALIVSKKSNTLGIIQNTFSGYGNVLAVAEAPVTGAATPITLAYAGGDMFGGGSGFTPSIGNSFG